MEPFGLSMQQLTLGTTLPTFKKLNCPSSNAILQYLFEGLKNVCGISPLQINSVDLDAISTAKRAKTSKSSTCVGDMADMSNRSGDERRIVVRHTSLICLT